MKLWRERGNRWSGWVGAGLAAVALQLASGPATAAASGGTLYVADYGTATMTEVPTDGSGASTLLAGLPQLRGATVDPVHAKLYWAEAGPNKLRRSNFDGSLVEDVVTGLAGAPWDVAVDGAGGKVYWTEYYGILAIRRANLDGSGVEDLVTSGLALPLGIALDLPAGKLYWADHNLGTIQRANLDGSAVEVVLSGLAQPRHIVLDRAAGVFYFTWGLGWGGVSRANLDGSGLAVLVAEAGDATGLALDVTGGRLYWPHDESGLIHSMTTSGDDRTVVASGFVHAVGLALRPEPGTVLYLTDYGTTSMQRVSTDGTGAAPLLSGLPQLRGATVDAVHAKLYWAEAGPNRLRRSNLDGSAVEDVVTGLAGAPWDVAVDGAAGKVYWTEYYGIVAIRRANLDGSGVEDLVLSGMAFPLGIALDTAAGKFYWSDHDLGTIQRANLDGSAVEVVLSGLSQPRHIVVDRAAGVFYFTWGLGWGGLSRANLDGSGLAALFAEPGNTVGLVLDAAADRLYWAEDSSGSVQSMTTSGADRTTVANGFVHPVGLAASGLAAPAEPAEQVRLVDSTGQGLAGAVVTYYYGGWQSYGVTGADGRVSVDLPDGSYTFRIEYGGATVQKVQNIVVDPVVRFATRDVAVQLRDSAGNPLDPGVADYYAAGWKPFGSTAGGEVHKELLPTSYTFAMSYAGGRVQKAQNVAVDPVVQFATRDVAVQLRDSAGNPLDPGVAEYYAAGWKPFGSTAGGEVHRELLPTSYTFAMSYAGARVQKAQNVAVDPVVQFATRDVAVQLRDSAGNPLDPGVAEYYAAGWKPFGSTAGGEVHKELLPTSYTFAMSYAGGRVQKAQNVAVDPVVVFQTGSVVSDSNSCTGYYAGGWRSFTTGMQLLPTTYTFRFSTGTPAQQSFAITAGVENHIR